MANINPLPRESLNTNLRRAMFGQVALPSLQSIQGLIYEESRSELQFPACVKVYEKMMLEGNVAAGPNTFKMMISKIPWRIEAPKGSSEEEVKRAALLNRNIHDMVRPWSEYMNEILSILVYGFVPLEKVFSINEYDGEEFIGLKHFPVISQPSIEKWYRNDDTGALAGLRQSIYGLCDRSSENAGKYTKDIPSDKFILFRHNPERDNPEGVSPLKAVWLAWKYLSLIEEFETIGISKDLGGVLKIGIHHEIYKEAANDPTSWQALWINDLEKKAAAITAGEQTFIIHPLEYEDGSNTKPLYSFDVMGVIGGGGKSYDTSSIVERHSNKILMAFFADVLKLGSSSHGSFALADSKTSMLSMAVESILSSIKTTLNHNLIRHIYKMNNWGYNPLTSARFVYGDIEKPDLDVLSKAVQRVFSVEAVQRTDDIEDKLRQYLFDLDTLEISGAEVRELSSQPASRAGDGMKSAGPGTSNSFSGGDRSVSNGENADSSLPIRLSPKLKQENYKEEDYEEF